MRELYQGQFESYRNMTDEQWDEYRKRLFDSIWKQAEDGATRRIAIRLYDEGMEISKIAKVTDETQQQIKYWIDWECKQRMTEHKS